jgi:tetratricopeptide (TPR) repeat protein
MATALLPPELFIAAAVLEEEFRVPLETIRKEEVEALRSSAVADFGSLVEYLLMCGARHGWHVNESRTLAVQLLAELYVILKQPNSQDGLLEWVHKTTLTIVIGNRHCGISDETAAKLEALAAAVFRRLGNLEAGYQSAGEAFRLSKLVYGRLTASAAAAYDAWLDMAVELNNFAEASLCIEEWLKSARRDGLDEPSNSSEVPSIRNMEHDLWVLRYFSSIGTPDRSAGLQPWPAPALASPRRRRQLLSIQAKLRLFEGDDKEARRLCALCVEAVTQAPIGPDRDARVLADAVSTLLRAGDQEEALRITDRFLQPMFEQLTEPIRVCSCGEVIAQVAFASGRMQQASSAITRCLAACDQLPQQWAWLRALFYTSIAVIQLGQGLVPQAESTLNGAEESLKVYRRSPVKSRGDIDSVELMYAYNKARVLELRGRINDAVLLLDLAIQTGERGPIKDIVLMALARAYRLHLLAGNVFTGTSDVPTAGDASRPWVPYFMSSAA